MVGVEVIDTRAGRGGGVKQQVCGRPEREERDQWRLPKYRTFGSSRATSAPLPSFEARLPLRSINPESLPGFYFSIFAIRRMLGVPSICPSLCRAQRATQSSNCSCVFSPQVKIRRFLTFWASFAVFVISTNASCSPG